MECSIDTTVEKNKDLTIDSATEQVSNWLLSESKEIGKDFSYYLETIRKDLIEFLKTESTEMEIVIFPRIRNYRHFVHWSGTFLNE